MAGTLKVGTITTPSGSGSITIPSGVTLSGGGLANTPAFMATLSANQSVTNATNTKCAFNQTEYDTDNAFDTTNSRFTVPSGKAGKYVFLYGGYLNFTDNDAYVSFFIYKNGSVYNLSYHQANTSSAASGIVPNGSATMDLAVGDYVELYIVHNTSSAKDLFASLTRFSGHRLIGV